MRASRLLAMKPSAIFNTYISPKIHTPLLFIIGPLARSWFVAQFVSRKEKLRNLQLHRVAERNVE
jgi:hypothetical protein